MKVFHLTYWHPNQQNPNEGIWIRRHIEALQPHVESQFVYHLEIKRASGWYLNTSKIHDNHSVFRLSAPIPWWLIEIISSFIVTFILVVKARRYNIVNIHIAYPLLTYVHIIRKLLRNKLVITEHWSAYHFNFGVKRALPRAQRIFSNDLPLITVSESLRIDIERFSSQTFTTTAVVPNTVDGSIFSYREVEPRNGKVFFMLAQWKWPKQPELIIKAFARFMRDTEYSQSQLRIGGSGPLLDPMMELVSSLCLKDNVFFLGDLPPVSVAREMNLCSAFLHCSEYETFSVVCAEAVCCGAPVIASAVGGIPEFINRENGVLVKEASTEGWLETLRIFNGMSYDRKRISQTARERFSFETVGQEYFNFLESL